MITKESIEKKLEIVHKQMIHCGYDKYYLEPLLKHEKEFFSDDVELYSEAIMQIHGLVANSIAWDNMVNASEDKFIKEFKNYNEYFHFAVKLMEDINAYNEERLRH